MALPVTITGVTTTNTAPVGPFLSSAGNVYFFAKDAASNNLIIAMKATDPTSSFAKVGTSTGGDFASSLYTLAGCQVGDVIHLAGMFYSGGIWDLQYCVFSMVTDNFTVNEKILDNINTNSSGGAGQSSLGIVYRTSDNQPLIVHQGPQVANMGSSYSRVYYTRRTGVNTWSAGVILDAGGTSDYVEARAIIGSSNRTHSFHRGPTNAPLHRAISSANVLQTAGLFGSSSAAVGAVPLSYNNAGTQKIFVLNSVPGATDAIGHVRADSADTLTPSTSNFISGSTSAYQPFNDGTDVWVLYRGKADSDIYVIKSTDGGATWGSPILSYTGTVSDSSNNLSRDGNVFTRPGGDTVLPYLLVEGTTLYYNEYVVRVGFSGSVLLANDVNSASSVQQGANLKQVHALLANDVKSNSSVSQPTMYLPAVEQALLANDVLSLSSVKQATAVIRRDALANDVLSTSSVTNPAIQQRQTLLANDVLSPSSVTKPTQLRQLQALLANDVKSNSTVSIPAATIRRDVLANDVLSPSSVTQATALINRGALANDVLSTSKVTNPAAILTGAILANDVLSTSSVSSPTLVAIGGGTEPGELLVLTYTPGTNRNDFTGQVGVRIGIGTTDIPINWIGTRANGYGGTRTVKLYEWFGDTLVSSATIDLTGKTEGDWVWVPVTPFSLLANGYYALMMDVVASDGNWWRNPGPVTMQASIVNIYDCYRAGAPLATGGVNASFVGLDLGWGDTGPDTEDNCTANDVISLSSVTQPQVHQAQSVLANDVISASSVGRPAVKQLQAILANDVTSPSSVSQPIAGIWRDVLANDVVSPSKVTNPLAVIGRTVLANDVVSPSSVSQPLAAIQRAILANDVVSPSKVSNPIVGIVGVIDARDITSASSVTQPALKLLHGLLANDVKSPSSVTQPSALIVRNVLANDITSASSVTKPVVGEITAGQPLAEDVISRSSVSIPTLVVVGQPPITVPPIVPPAHGGGAGYIGAKAKERLAELIEIAYRKALKIKEPEVVEAIRAAVKEAIPERQAQRLQTEDFERLAADLSVVKGLLAEIERAAKEIEIKSAIDALIEYEIALEEDDAEALLIAA